MRVVSCPIAEMAAATWTNATRLQRTVNEEDAAAVSALGCGSGASLEDRVGYLTEQLMALEQVKMWKRALQTEVAKAEYSVNDLQ